jgi:TRAP transporter TAXI family solute receptor
MGRKPAAQHASTTKPKRDVLHRLLGRYQIVIILAVLLAVATLAWAMLAIFAPVPPSRIIIAGGPKGGSYEQYAMKYREILARSHVKVDVRTTGGAEENLRLLEDPHAGVVAGFALGGIANRVTAPDVKSLGRVKYTAIFVFYRASERLTDLAELKGKRIVAGPAGSGTRIIGEMVLKAYGVTSDNATFLPLSGFPAVEAMESGKADVQFVASDLDAPTIQRMLRNPEMRLLSLRLAKALTRNFPFLTRLELPEGVIDHEKNIPLNDVTLVGTTASVLVRDDLNPAIVRLLAAAVEEVHRGPGIFNQLGEFPSHVDLDFPMSEDALDYYKNGPSFLNRYLPFWFATYVRRGLALLITVLAVALPMFSYAPKIYQWLMRRHILTLYRNLRLLDAKIRSGLSTRDLTALQTEVSDIEQAASVLPMRYSDLFFQLRSQIDLTRGRLARATAEPTPAPGGLSRANAVAE